MKINNIVLRKLNQELEIDHMSIEELRNNWQRIWERYIELWDIISKKIIKIKQMKKIRK